MKEIISELKMQDAMHNVFGGEWGKEAYKAVKILSGKFLVRDWLTGEVRTFDNYDEAKENYDETVKASLDANGREGDCDVQLLVLVEELNNID